MSIIEKIKEGINKILRKTRRGAAIGTLMGMAATATLTTGCGDKSKDFKQQYECDVEALDLGKNNAHEKEQQKIIERLDNSKSEQDVKNLLKEIYIKETGDNTLKTEDITISGPNNQSFVYVNEKTGDIITHGKHPDEVVQTLKRNGVSYTTKDDVDVYRVEHKDGKVIDCMTLQSEDENPVRVIVGDQYDETYESVLVRLGNIIPNGLEYAKFIETENINGKEGSKAQLKKDLEEFENKKARQKKAEPKTEEEPDKELEHE